MQNRTSLPETVRRRLLDSSDVIGSTVNLLTDPAGCVVGLHRDLPGRVALPGGISSEEIECERLRDLPASKEEGNEGCSALLLVRFQGACASAEALKSAAVMAIGGVPLDADSKISSEQVKGRRTLFLDFFFDASGDPAIETPAAPWCDPSGKALEAKLACEKYVDAIAYVRRDATGAEVLDAVVEAVERQITAITATIDSSEDAACVRHFPVLANGVIVSVVSGPSEETEDEDVEASVERRKAVHEALLLPTDRPLMRKRNGDDWERSGQEPGTGVESRQDDGGFEGRLSDVHIGIKSHGLGEKGVTVHLVRGKYLYCHYMQDKFNDSGWGCAYRSLQTLMSWCVFQDLASFPGGILPTHRQMQQALVEIGDKPGKFIGSREWIGANECCYVLEKVTGVSSRILHVSRGSEMESKGRELARHFDDVGSPIMIGGGVLAWTILGVARDGRTGKTRFLILDPHYEGKDDLKTIHAKGWVAWKSADIFKPNSFYNLCIPQVPRCV